MTFLLLIDDSVSVYATAADVSDAVVSLFEDAPCGVFNDSDGSWLKISRSENNKVFVETFEGRSFLHDAPDCGLEVWHILVVGKIIR